jgi:signal transduction histidine kinase
VLVVDDEYGPRESIAFTLGTEFEVDTAERAREALEKIARETYAVIILDIRMPEMDGIKALERIRDLDPEVAVVMLTGYGTLATAQQAMLGGANQYLRKPPDIEELIESVRQQAAGTVVRRQEAQSNSAAKHMLEQLKREMTEVETDVWQGRASVELVHDLANPLTVMIGYSGLLQEEARNLAADAPLKAAKFMEYAQIVERAAEYCHHLAENWRKTSHKSAEFTDVDLVQLADEMHRVMFFSNGAITFSGMNSLVVKGTRLELARVFQNLFRNALEAGARKVEVEFAVEDGRPCVAVADDGSGMNPDTMQRALKGGFTTKEHGTGLGLSICRHLLGAHGAALAVESIEGEGTTIQISFPGDA